jgi:hypothetical protein
MASWDKRLSKKEGGFSMKWDKDENEKSTGEPAEVVLEISSTGYGLESVSKSEVNSDEKERENPSGCGGL